MAAWNSAFKQYKSEERAFRIAITAVKKAGYKKVNEKYSKMEGETTASSLDPEGKTVSATFGKKKKKKKKPVTDTEVIRAYNLKGKEKKRVLHGLPSQPLRNQNKKGGIKMKKMSKFVKWSTKYKNALPDSAFAVVVGEGDKKVRKLPYKDANGKVDIPHLRNALVRVAQGRTALNPAQRASALRKLRSVAKKYLKTYKETKSGEIMVTAISKFESGVRDKLLAIVKTLKSKATNLKPEDEVSFSVKSIGLLIQDLEEITEYEKAKEDEKEAEKKEEETKTEEKDYK